MSKTILIILVFLLCQHAAAEIEIENINKCAESYAEYDEEISNVTIIIYSDKSYYLIDYSRIFVNSGSLILDEYCVPVKDDEIITVIITSRIFNKYYMKSSADYWLQISKTYSKISQKFNKYDDVCIGNDNNGTSILLQNFEILINNSNEISFLSKQTSFSLSNSINNLSPKDTKKYMESESKIIEKLDEMSLQCDKLIEKIQNADNKKNEEDHIKFEKLIKSIKQDQNFIKETSNALKGNRDNLMASVNPLLKEIKSRGESKERRTDITRIMMISVIALGIIVIIALFVKR